VPEQIAPAGVLDIVIPAVPATGEEGVSVAKVVLAVRFLAIPATDEGLI
jgi:hypothetical protein